MTIKTKETLTLQFTSKSGYASLDLIVWPSGWGTLANVYSRRRGQGHARDAMEQAMVFCDDNEIELRLIPESYGPGSSPEKTERLYDFYKKFGFMKKRSGWMVRKPNKES